MQDDPLVQGPVTRAMQADAPLLLNSPRPQAVKVESDVVEMLLLNLPVLQSIQDNAPLLLYLPWAAINAG